MKKRRDFSLYLVTDRILSAGKSLEEIVTAAVKGGVTTIQLREKECSTSDYIELANHVKNILIETTIPLIINDRLDVALAVCADGVHIGQNDMPYALARHILGPEAIIGLTVETPEQAANAESLSVDYLGVSAIFATPTKTDTIHEWGLDGLSTLRSVSSHPLIAIGGINHKNAAQVLHAGADGLAVVSAICSAADPESATRELSQIIRSYQKKAL